MDHGFGVGVAFEGVTARHELALQLGEILDDAVMDDGDPPAHVRMGIALVGLAMGRPARVADADLADQRAALEQRAQIDQLAFGAPPVDRPVDHGRDAGGIVSAIFQPTQPVDQKRRDVSLADDTYDPAHRFPSLTGMPAPSRRANGSLDQEFPRPPDASLQLSHYWRAVGSPKHSEMSPMRNTRAD